MIRGMLRDWAYHTAMSFTYTSTIACIRHWIQTSNYAKHSDCDNVYLMLHMRAFGLSQYQSHTFYLDIGIGGQILHCNTSPGLFNISFDEGPHLILLTGLGSLKKAS